ncbi:hypothetical protein [Bradyrhizobium sp.]|uniref:hypothetical protein n=1 Tax=Bradyrhizobium sp. TaxID=376 RepID=UPI003C67C124
MSTRTDASLEIDAAHCRAICEEIGYRLGELWRREGCHELPPRLDFLMQQLANIEIAPSLVPSLDDMIGTPSPRGRAQRPA